MDISGEVPRPNSQDRSVTDRIDDRGFLTALRESAGQEVCELIESSRPTGPAVPTSIPLKDVSESVRRKLRLVVASDAMRGCLERSLLLELACTADGNFDLWPPGRVSRPPTPTEELYFHARTELPSAIAIINLVNGRIARSGGFYAHTPKGLAGDDADQLVRLMSVRQWRKALEMRFGIFFGFRAPYHLAAATSLDHPYLREFVSLEEQARAGLFPSDP